MIATPTDRMTDRNKRAAQKALDDYQLINQPPTYFSGRKGGDAAAAARSKVAFVVFVFLLQPEISGGLGGNGRGVIAVAAGSKMRQRTTTRASETIHLNLQTTCANSVHPQ